MDDPVRFASIAQVCNCLFGCSYQEDTKGPRRGYFTPATLKSTRFEGWKVWFPVHYVEGMRDDKHWKKVIDPETAAIREYAPTGTRTGGAALVDEPTRAVFLRERHTLTGRSIYRFAGTYRQTAEEGDEATYSRVAESLGILRSYLATLYLPPTPATRSARGAAARSARGLRRRPARITKAVICVSLRIPVLRPRPQPAASSWCRAS